MLDSVRGGRGAARRRRAGFAALAGAVVVAGGLAAVEVAGRSSSPSVAALDLEPAVVAGCRDVAGTVTLDRPASEGGTDVHLAASEPAVDVPGALTVPTGATRAQFTAGTRSVAEAADVEVRATAGGDNGDAAPAGAPPARGTVAAPLRVEPVDAATLGDEPTPACLGAFREHHGYQPAERAGAFDAERIAEASGLAASRRNPGWLYIVDDDHPEEVWAARTDGGGLRAIPVAGFVGRDTEDLAVGPCGPDTTETCVFVGDVGDNLQTHPDVEILRFAEPDVSAPPRPVVPDVIRVRYPGGPADAEALLVDDAGVPHVVTKDAGSDGAGAARLYAAPGFADGTLTDLGPVALPDPALPLVASVLGVVVTGADYHDGRVLLRTYDHVVEFVAPDLAAPLAEFASWPAREVPAAREPQSEAVAFAADGCGYYTAGEGVGDLWFVGCRR